jgi:hypothetical protein
MHLSIRIGTDRMRSRPKRRVQSLCEWAAYTYVTGEYCYCHFRSSYVNKWMFSMEHFGIPATLILSPLYTVPSGCGLAARKIEWLSSCAQSDAKRLHVCLCRFQVGGSIGGYLSYPCKYIVPTAMATSSNIDLSIAGRGVTFHAC